MIFILVCPVPGKKPRVSTMWVVTNYIQRKSDNTVL